MAKEEIRSWRVENGLIFSAGPRRVLRKRSDKAAWNTGQIADSVVMTDNLATLLENEVDRSIGKWR